jgi:hypothetical protein
VGSPEAAPDLGWHAISGELLLSALRRCEGGGSADLVYAELWANSERAEEDDGT